MVRNTTMNVPRSLFIGFEPILNELERIHSAGRSQDNYPPHNVVKIDNEHFIIELAVAGFTNDDISIEVKDGILLVKGESSNDDREYAHKGISSRKFEKSFRLSEFVVIGGADLVNGILVVNARVEVPEERRPRKIEIGSTGTSTKKGLLNE
jgi:molecular chaperone IbpA|tara:strand:- start:322 stop:777 length:456 start_codon:yes stop_codon:yes gene_type:complete